MDGPLFHGFKSEFYQKKIETLVPKISLQVQKRKFIVSHSVTFNFFQLHFKFAFTIRPLIVRQVI